MREEARDRFVQDVSQHKMEIIREDGLYRHIRFKRPNESAFYFDLITWPGHLCITGDMDTHVFSRTRDMFEFFRRHGQDSGKPDQLSTNPGYWAEKILSGGKSGATTKEFSEEKFRSVLEEQFKNHFSHTKPDDDASDEDKKTWLEKKEECWAEIEDQILSLDNLQHDGYHAAEGFDAHGFRFSELWDYGGFEEYTFHFIWACYAIAWGIKQYDLAKVEVVPQSAN